MPVMVKKTMNVEQDIQNTINNSDNIENPIQEKNDDSDNENEVVKIRCRKCGLEKETTKFYPCYSKKNTTGFSYLCKDCCEVFGLDDGKFTKSSAYRLCKLLDKPYKEEYFLYCQNPKFKTEKSKIGAYLQISNLSKGGARKEGFSLSEEVNATISPEEMAEMQAGEQEKKIRIFGEGFEEEEYDWLYNKYNILINNYPIRTELHREMLIKYCKYALREDQAIANNSVNDAKYWGDLASKTATNAKINPNQLSSADLSDGLTCFSQLAQQVEKEVDIIECLPKYIAKPLDRVDYTIYMIIDYIRDLEGKPHVDYKDVWQYMFDENKRNKKKFPKDVVPENENKPDPNAILVDGENGIFQESEE